MTAPATSGTGRRKAHLLRPAPPWREGSATTVCGRDATTVWAISLADARASLRSADLAARRAAHAGLCRTCEQRAHDLPLRWAARPVAAMRLDIEGWDSDRHELVAAELRALAALALQHLREYRSLLEAERVLVALGGSRGC